MSDEEQDKWDELDELMSPHGFGEHPMEVVDEQEEQGENSNRFSAFEMENPDE